MWGMWITIIMITKTTVTCDTMWRNAPLMHSARTLSDDGGASLAVALCCLICSENWIVTRAMFWTRDATRVVFCWTIDAADCIGFCSVSSAARIDSVAVHWTLWRRSILSVYNIGIYGCNWIYSLSLIEDCCWWIILFKLISISAYKTYQMTALYHIQQWTCPCGSAVLFHQRVQGHKIAWRRTVDFVGNFVQTLSSVQVLCLCHRGQRILD